MLARYVFAAVQLASGLVSEALEFGKAHLRRYMTATLPENEAAVLRDTLALLAYNNIQACPMRYLVECEHRGLVAHTVNSAILRHLKQGDGESAGSIQTASILTSLQWLLDDGHVEKFP
jgi:hypothetical protein